MEIDIIAKLSSAGHHPSPNTTLTLWHDKQEQGASVPWVARCIFSGERSGQPHPFTGSGAPPGGMSLPVRFSGVVSEEPLYDRPSDGRDIVSHNLGLGFASKYLGYIE